MKIARYIRIIGLPTLGLSGTALFAENASPETSIWMDAPAKNFTESSPLGNGRLGAMMFGGVNEERIVLNESSVWAGSRQDADRPEAYKVAIAIEKSRSGFEVTIKSEKPALWTWLEFDGTEARFSDNFIHVKPKAPETISVQLSKELSKTDFEKGLRVRSLVDTYVPA